MGRVCKYYLYIPNSSHPPPPPGTKPLKITEETYNRAVNALRPWAKTIIFPCIVQRVDWGAVEIFPIDIEEDEEEEEDLSKLTINSYEAPTKPKTGPETYKDDTQGLPFKVVGGNDGDDDSESIASAAGPVDFGGRASTSYNGKSRDYQNMLMDDALEFSMVGKN
jgi:hypothetical protein